MEVPRNLRTYTLLFDRQKSLRQLIIDEYHRFEEFQEICALKLLCNTTFFQYVYPIKNCVPLSRDDPVLKKRKYVLIVSGNAFRDENENTMDESNKDVNLNVSLIYVLLANFANLVVHFTDEELCIIFYCYVVFNHFLCKFLYETLYLAWVLCSSQRIFSDLVESFHLGVIGLRGGRLNISI